MKNPKFASRYASALYDFALETNDVETVLRDILKIADVIKVNKELKTILESPIIPQEKKLKIVSAVFETNLSEISLKFFMLIVKKRRVPQLLMICEQFVKIYNKNHFIKVAQITSAQPLSEEMVRFVKNYMEEGSEFTYQFELTVDHKIIGGLIVKVEDFYFDASIQAKINKLKAEFSQNKYAIAF